MDAVNTIQLFAQFANVLIISLIAAAVITWAWKKFRASDLSSRRLFLGLTGVFNLAFFVVTLLTR